MSARLASHIRVGLLRRKVESDGGYATVLRRGEAVAGELLLVVRERGGHPRLLLPTLSFDSPAGFEERAGSVDESELADWIAARAARDSDLWVLELDVADSQRLIAELASFA